ncbi:MAG: hypothetical protein FJ116_11620 [Deltaproteobacteria bacterium]|nr:hypothetical protein [Deltaproteobacteria bacterium]
MGPSTKKNEKSWVSYWVLIFFIVNLICHLSAGTNAASRFATLLAIEEEHSFAIDHYIDLTVDWARTPDGHYYSNKAPGPVLLAAPLFYLLVKMRLAGVSDRQQRVNILVRSKASWLKLFSYLFQLIPFIGLVFFFAKQLIEQNKSLSVVYLSLGAILFGNTAALFMSTYYGHGLTAVCVLGMVLFAQRHRYYEVGACFGWAVLSDYSAVLLGLPLLVLIHFDRKNYFRLFLGGVVPFVLWLFYHKVCFGSPFLIANQFQNPEFQDVLTENNNLWGILHLFPRMDIFKQLTIGFSRGMFWVVPWIIVLVLWSIFMILKGQCDRVPKELKFALSGLFLLLAMNCCFGGWHGGLTPGPRYLSSIFPVFGVSLAMCWNQMTLLVQRITFVSVCVSVVFSVLVYSTHISPPQTSLWPLYLEQTLIHPSSTTLVRLIVIVPLLTFIGVKTLKWPVRVS